MFLIRLGVPEIEELWKSLSAKFTNKTISKDEKKLYKQIGKAMFLLSKNPKHPGLQSHEINPLTRRYGIKVFQSYLENKTSNAGRIYWVYGPNKKEITIIGIEPHPEDKKKAGYDKVKLSSMGQEEPN